MESAATSFAWTRGTWRCAASRNNTRRPHFAGHLHSSFAASSSSLGARAGELAVLRHVPDGFARHVELFAEERELVVAVGEAGVRAQRRFVDLDRFFLAVHVDEQDAEVVEDERLGAAGSDGAAVRVLGL